MILFLGLEPKEDAKAAPVPLQSDFDAVCRCLTEAIRSYSKIASITGNSGPSFGFSIGLEGV
ncbi:hypothetical protein FV226_21745 [Methylobacterium sp. WL12]|uniref:hypothetical protein n=1 Tax=Methylobacterium sp. WL12 TaxID=2603890 RepID=UPI0011C8ACB4|nr:hypothetical protein [Methylobacterium sp. WL12]TXM67458.1 hypothetical protein FV226_21745 [Methylobacterium sp. WL12]